jgi:serine/threonine protein kinase
MALLLGTRLGPYEILTLLGAGGMGEVYRARDSQLHRDVAVKVLSNLSSDPDRVRRFEQEARAAASLSHPNILAVHQLGIHAGVPYLVSELLEGETLREQIRCSRLPARKAIEYAAQIARGLAAAHEKGIVHRDLKPENLFVTRDQRVKILDFGLAKLIQPPRSSKFGESVTQGSELGTVMGTVGYMSPEQVRGETTDSRTDIFAFGTILYEMLTGNRAFQRPTSAETNAAILNEDPPRMSHLWPDIPPALQRVVYRCMEKKPEGRFQSASDLAFAVESLSDSGNISFPHAVPLPRSRRTAGRIAAAGVVLIATVLLVWWKNPNPPEVEGVAQLTDDNNPKATFSTIVSDDSRVYFDEMDSGRNTTKQVSTSGGQSSPVLTSVPASLQGSNVAGLSPDASALLVLGHTDPSGLWLQPLPAGEPRQLGTIKADDAGFFPDGRIVFTSGPSIYVAERDGSWTRKLANFAGNGGWPQVSPDGKRIRFTITGDDLTISLWEIGSDGAGLHQLLPGWHDPPNECCGKWTRDGKYFVFQSLNEGRWDLWTLPEARGTLRRFSGQPLRLTNGPLSYSLPCPSRDGQRIFAIGSKRRGELVRYDFKTQQLVPYASGVSAIDSRVSPDGRWVVYISYPDHTLWRSRPDGSEHLQLTFPPMVVFFLAISPDGTKVAFAGFIRARRDLSLYIVNIEGGVPQEITGVGAMAWSPDQNSIAFTAPAPGKHQAEKNFLQDYVVDLHTKKVSTVPESLGMSVPFWPDANTLLAEQMDTGKIMAFDFKTQKWSEFTHTEFGGYWTPSPDGKYLYSEMGGAIDPKVVRVRLADRKIETVLSLKGIHRVVDETLYGVNFPTWVGVAPDGSVLLTRDVGSQEVYALSVRWP